MRLIINADDYGMNADVNLAIIELFSKKLLDRASIMVNMPSTGDAVELAIKNKLVDKIGLHINLTEGIPLTESIKKTSICDNKGEMRLTNFHFMNRIYLSKELKDAIREEIVAQIEKYHNLGFSLNHADSHNYTTADWSIERIAIQCCSKHKIKSLRIAKNIKSVDNNGIKLLYRKIANIKLKMFNSLDANNQSSDYFGSITDVQSVICTRIHDFTNSTIELMVHPIVKSYKIIDHYTFLDLEEPLSFLRKLEKEKCYEKNNNS